MAIQALQVNLVPLNSMCDAAFKLLCQMPHKRSVLDALTDKRILSPLGCAVQTGRVDIVKKVLEMGATVDRRHDVIGLTPLYTAIGLISHHTRQQFNAKHAEMNKYSDMSLKTVRAHAAGVLPHNLEHLKQAIDEQDRNPRLQNILETLKEYERSNISQYTSADGFRKIAKLLIEQGADPNAKHDTVMTGYTPLMLAIELDEAELVEVMLGSAHHQINWADTCVDSRSRRRVGLEQLAIYWRSKRVVQLLSNRFNNP